MINSDSSAADRNTPVEPAPWNDELPRRSNPFAIAGLAVAALAVLLGWVPMLGWVLWLGGLCCSLIGLMKQPRWPAVGGLVISVTVLVLALCISAIGSNAVFGFFSWLSRTA